MTKNKVIRKMGDRWHFGEMLKFFWETPKNGRSKISANIWPPPFLKFWIRQSTSYIEAAILLSVWGSKNDDGYSSRAGRAKTRRTLTISAADRPERGHGPLDHYARKRCVGLYVNACQFTWLLIKDTHCFISKMTLLLDPGLGLASSEYRKWRS